MQSLLKINITGQKLLIEKDGKPFDIPIASIRSYSMRIHHNKLNSIDTVQWIIRYLPRKKISLSVSSDDSLNDNLLAMAGARQSLAEALDLQTNHTMFRKPNFFASKTAFVIACAVAAGFIIFSAVGSYLTGKFNVGLLVLTASGCYTPFLGLSIMRAESQHNNYTMCNPNPQMP